MAIVTVGIDLAMNVFAVLGVDETGKPVLVRPEVPRAKLLELIDNLPACLIGMDARSGAHQRVRDFSSFGHTVRLMAPKFITPYRMSGKHGKNDANDGRNQQRRVQQPMCITQPSASAKLVRYVSCVGNRLGLPDSSNSRIRSQIRAIYPFLLGPTLGQHRTELVADRDSSLCAGAVIVV